MPNRPVWFDICLGDSEYETTICVSYMAHKGCRGSRDGQYGLQIEPDEPPFIEIDYVVSIDGRKIELSKKEEYLLRELINEYEWDKLQDSREP